jgi:hypothetical protein
MLTYMLTSIKLIYMLISLDVYLFIAYVKHVYLHYSMPAKLHACVLNCKTFRSVTDQKEAKDRIH